MSSTSTLPAAATLAVAATKITVVAWRDPVLDATSGAHPTASDDALITGRARVFDCSECVQDGAR